MDAEPVRHLEREGGLAGARGATKQQDQRPVGLLELAPDQVALRSLGAEAIAQRAVGDLTQLGPVDLAQPTPAKVALDFAVKMDKPDFVGRTALQRLATLPRERSLLPMTFAGRRAPEEGAQLFVNGTHVGNLTSSRFSPALGCGVALGWIRHPVGTPPTRVTARDTQGDVEGVITRGPFYDPTGARLRA